MKLTGLAVNLVEAITTRFENEPKWTLTGSIYTTDALKLSGLEYVLKVEVMNDSFRFNYLNLAFAQIKDGQALEVLTSAEGKESAVIGAVCNALKDKINQLVDEYEGIDALVFFIDAAEPKRQGLYKRIISSNQYGLSPWRYQGTISSKIGHFLIATERSLTKAEFDQYRLDLAQATGKALK